MKIARVVFIFILICFPSLAHGQSGDTPDCNLEALEDSIDGVTVSTAEIETILTNAGEPESVIEELEQIESHLSTIRENCVSQTTSTLQYGEAINGFLLSGETTTHSFTASEGDVVTISAEKMSGSADLAMELYDPSGRLLFSDDDSNPDGFLNPQIADISLSETGNYEIVVTRCSFCDQNSSASYNLTIMSAESNEENAASASTLQYGETINGFLLSGETTTHSFTASEGDVVTISAEKMSGSADLAMELYDPSGRLLFSDDDSNPDGFLNPQIANLPLPATGDYEIVVTRCSFCDQNSSASYTLTIIE